MTTYKNFKISANFQGCETNTAWGDNGLRNKYFVYVTNTDNGEKTRFTFWDSLDNTQRGVVLDGDDLLSAFYCFVSDVCNGLYSFSDFCGEFGYDEDSRSAERIYNACKRAYKSFIRVSGFDESGLYDFVNDLREIAG